MCYTYVGCLSPLYNHIYTVETQGGVYYAGREEPGSTLHPQYNHTYLRLEVLHVFGGGYPQQHSEGSETVLGEGLPRDLDDRHDTVEQLPEERQVLRLAHLWLSKTLSDGLRRKKRPQCKP